MAEQKAYLEDWKAEWDAGQCSVSAAIACRIQTVTGTYTVKTVDLSLEALETSTAKTYIGTPPSEIRSLYGDTRDTASAAVTAGDAWTAAGCSTASSDGCTSLMFDFSRAVDALDTKFAAWSPYL